jgi:hypothetical protein
MTPRRQGRNSRAGRGVPSLVAALSAGAILSTGAACSTGCVMHITPPAAPPDPVSVFVADYGYHSSVILPREAGDLVEFAYGEWRWFALNESGWWRALPVTLGSHAGTLGMRTLAGPAELDAVRRHLAAEALYELRVARTDVDALRTRLQYRFDQQRERMIYNPQHRLHFVPDEARYGPSRNCNTETAAWLRALGCKVSGCDSVARLAIAEPAVR